MRDRTLGWKCSNCGNCSWSRSFKPVEGWNAKPTCFVDREKVVHSYIVASCPEFKPLTKLRRDKDFDLFSLYRIYKKQLKPAEITFLENYFSKTIDDAVKTSNMPERSFYRKLSELKDKLKSLEIITKILAEGNHGFEKD